MITVIFDTNFLLMPFTLNVDIYTELEHIMLQNYQICILDDTLQELDKIIENQTGKDKRNAKLAKKLLDMKNVKILSTKSLKSNMNSAKPDVDSMLLQLPKEYLIATQDKELKRKLKENNYRIIHIRAKKKLEIV